MTAAGASPRDVRALIESRVREALAPTRLELVDESPAHRGHAGNAAGGGYFKLLVVSPAFEGKSPVARHRMVYACLSDAMRQEIHALAITARTPAEDDAGRGSRS